MFSAGLQLRISPKVEAFLGVEQAGFRKGFSTIDHLQVVAAHRKVYRIRKPLYLAFIDYQKAFDSIEHLAIWKSLTEAKVHPTYINITKYIYENCKSRVKLEKMGPEIKIERGIRQGDPLSPTLFIAVLEHKMRDLQWEGRGITVSPKNLTHLCFADDIVLISDMASNLQYMLTTLHTASKDVGLGISLQKTKIMTNYNETPMYIDNTEIAYVQNFVYLGKEISFNPSNNIEEIDRRIKKTWNKFWSMKEILKSRLPLNLKKKVIDSCLLPTMTYGSQTWKYTQAAKHKITTCQRAIERNVMKIKLKDKIRHSEIRAKTKITDALEYSLKSKWKWAGHVARMHAKRWTKVVTMWTGPSGKRRTGRPYSRWSDDLRKIATDWPTTATDTERWLELEEAFTREGFKPN